MPRKSKDDLPDRILNAALDRLASQGWRALTLSDIAAAAEIPLADLHRVYSSKAAILDAFGRRIDEAMLRDWERDADPDGGIRDRLFDLLMRRYEALVPYRPAVRRLFSELPGDPAAGLGLLPGLGRAMTWALEAAGVPAGGGLRGTLRVHGLGAIYVMVMRVWLDDDSPDLSKTMAALDARLRRAEPFAAWLRNAAPA